MHATLIRSNYTTSPHFSKAEPGPHDVCIQIVQTYAQPTGRFYSVRAPGFYAHLPKATKEEAQEAGRNLLQLYLMSRQSLTGK